MKGWKCWDVAEYTRTLWCIIVWTLAQAFLGLLHEIIVTAVCMFATHPGWISGMIIIVAWAYYADDDPG